MRFINPATVLLLLAGLWPCSLSAQLVPGGNTALGLNIDVNEQTLIDLGASVSLANASGQDAAGWPTSDFSLVLDNRYTFGWLKDPVNIDPSRYSTDLSGTYRLIFNGQAVVDYASASAYDPATNTTSANLTISTPPSGPGDLFVYVGFSRTKRTPADPEGSGISNLRLIRAGYGISSTQVFTDLWLDSIRRYRWSALRCMGVLGTNDYAAPGTPEAYPYRLNWSDRRLKGTGPLYANNHTGVHGSLAWEDLVTLANLTHTDLWINIPVNASSDYVDQLARLLKFGSVLTAGTGLPEDVNLYVEYSNEMWHEQFYQGAWNIQAARDEVSGGNTNLNYDGLPQSDATYRFRRIAKRTVEIGQQFRNVFSDDPARIRPVINNHLTDHDFDMLQYVTDNYGPPGTVLYGISQHGYYTSQDNSSVQSILQGEMAASDINRSGFVTSRSIATYFGLHSLVYEGGQAEAGNKDPYAPDPGLGNKFAAARDPGMLGVVVHDLMQNWYPSGGELYMSFSQVTRYSTYGMWGQSEDLANQSTGKWLGNAAVMQDPAPNVTAGISLPSAIGQSAAIPQLSGRVGSGSMVLLDAPAPGTYSFNMGRAQTGAFGVQGMMIDNTFARSGREGVVTVSFTAGLHSCLLFSDGRNPTTSDPATVTLVSNP